MPHMKKIVFSLLVVSLSGCSLPQLKMPDLKMPQVYKIPVQQGNVITQEMVDRLKPGMSRSQVIYVMGQPVLRDPFEANAWTYLYTIDVPGFYNQQIKMILEFDGDLLTTISGDLVPNEPQEEEASEGAGEDNAETSADETAGA